MNCQDANESGYSDSVEEEAANITAHGHAVQYQNSLLPLARNLVYVVCLQ